MSTRKTGDELEKEILEHLNSVRGQRDSDCGFRLCANSGAKWSDGDIRHQQLVIECKVKNTSKGMTVPIAELTKLKQLADTQCKDWVYVQKNATGTYVSMDLDTFLELTEPWRAQNA